MDLRQLRCFEAVARHRHFTRASEELSLSQMFYIWLTVAFIIGMVLMPMESPLHDILRSFRKHEVWHEDRSHSDVKSRHRT